MSVPIVGEGKSPLATLQVIGGSGTPGSSENIVLIDLKNNGVDVANLGFYLNFSPEYLSMVNVEPTDRTQSMNVFTWVESSAGKINFLLNDQIEFISAGEGPIIECYFDVSGSAPLGNIALSLSDPVLGDPSGNSIPTATIDGVFEVQEKLVTVSMDGYCALPNEIFKVSIDIDNDIGCSTPIAEMQIELSFNSSLVMLEEGDVIPTGRSDHMSIFNYEIFNGQLSLTISDDANYCIEPDVGPVVDLFFTASSDASGSTELQFLDVTLKDSFGDLINAEVLDGSITFESMVGDVDCNEIVNILDVLNIVNIILGIVDPSPYQFWASDYDENGLVNVIDVIGIVNIILYGPGGGSGGSGGDGSGYFSLPQIPGTNDHELVVDSDVSFAGVQAVVSYDTTEMTPGTPLKTDRSTNLILSSNVNSGEVVIVLYSDNLAEISPGTGSIVTLPFQASGSGKPCIALLRTPPGNQGWLSTLHLAPGSLSP